jgi:3-keto-5-aminohexanoate cleavage enzyme
MGAGARGIAVQRRWAHVERLARIGGMTLVDPGSVNVGLTRDGTVPPAAAEGPYQNSYADIDHMFRRSADVETSGPMRRDRQARPYGPTAGYLPSRRA